MKTKRNGLLVLLLAMTGCVSDQVSMRIDGANAGWQTASTRSKYHISSMRSRNPGLARMLKDAGGANATMQSGWIFTPVQIRKLERQYPSVFDDDGIPVDVDIEVATDNEMSLAKVPYCLLCGCTLCILPFYNSWSDTSIYRVKVSSSARTYSFSVKRKYESCWSLLGLNNLVPFFPLENADYKYRLSDLPQGEQASKLMTQAIISAICSFEGNSQDHGRTKIGKKLGD